MAAKGMLWHPPHSPSEAGEMASNCSSPRKRARRPAPVRRFLPDLIDLVKTCKINPGKVFDFALPLTDVVKGYRAIEGR